VPLYARCKRCGIFFNSGLHEDERLTTDQELTLKCPTGHVAAYTKSELVGEERFARRAKRVAGRLVMD